MSTQNLFDLELERSRLFVLGKKNAHADVVAIQVVVRRAERFGIVIFEITGAGRGFCAGADLTEFDFEPGPNLVERADPGPVIDQAFNPTTRRIQALRMPVIAAVNGVAAGAGASLALACDVAIAAPGAKFIQAFSKIGLVPDAGSSWFMPQRLGMARALALAMTGDALPAAQAKDWGLIWEVADDCVTAAMDMAQRLAAMPTTALVATRHLLRDGLNRSLNQQLDAERDTQSAMGRTHDYWRA